MDGYMRYLRLTDLWHQTEHKKTNRSLIFTGSRCVFKCDSHLLGNRHEEIIENLQHYGITLSSNRKICLTRLNAAQTKALICQYLQLPPRLNDSGGRRLSYNRGTRNGMTGDQIR